MVVVGKTTISAIFGLKAGVLVKKSTVGYFF
jgi:hypothetical protein